MCHKDNLPKFSLLDHGLQVPLLIGGGIWIVRRLIRCSAPEKIKSHNSPDGRKIWKKAIVEMKIIRKAVHQDDRRLFSRIFSDVNSVLISLHEMFCKIHSLLKDPCSSPPGGLI